jgi:DNA-binding response OmpR family regulator
LKNIPEILVVDDSHEVLALCKAILNNAGYAVVLAQTGKEAIQIVQGNKRIKLIFLDLNLPDLSGFKVLDEYNNLTNRDDLTVCILSSDKKKESVIKSLSMGASDYLLKPIKMPLILEKVNSVIGKPKEKLIATLNVSCKGSLVGEAILPDITITGVSEVGVEFMCSAKLLEEQHYEMFSVQLQMILGGNDSFELTVKKCRRKAASNYTCIGHWESLSEWEKDMIVSLSYGGKKEAS